MALMTAKEAIKLWIKIITQFWSNEEDTHNRKIKNKALKVESFLSIDSPLEMGNVVSRVSASSDSVNVTSDPAWSEVGVSCSVPLTGTKLAAYGLYGTACAAGYAYGCWYSGSSR